MYTWAGAWAGARLGVWKPLSGSSPRSRNISCADWGSESLVKTTKVCLAQDPRKWQLSSDMSGSILSISCGQSTACWVFVSSFSILLHES